MMEQHVKTFFSKQWFGLLETFFIKIKSKERMKTYFFQKAYCGVI